MEFGDPLNKLSYLNSIILNNPVQFPKPPVAEIMHYLVGYIPKVGIAITKELRPLGNLAAQTK